MQTYSIIANQVETFYERQGEGRFLRRGKPYVFQFFFDLKETENIDSDTDTETVQCKTYHQ